MALTKEQYDRIMLSYSKAQDKNRHALEERRRTVYARIPEYRALEGAIPDLGMAALRASLSVSGKDPLTEPVRQQMESVSRKKKELLLSHGFPENYLEMTYDCPDCRDTGYINGRKCHCLRAREIEVLYDQSRLKQLFQTENFDCLSEKYYQGEDLERFRRAVSTSRAFIENFGRDYENLYFYGTVGTGKSFLSVCIAREILNAGHSVIYFSASGLFDRISSYLYGRDRDEYRAFCADLYSCDLLIIDDLGTEVTNNFVLAQLFSCITERHLARKSTLISTNLSLEELQGRYSDRIFSRITSSYTLCKFTGPDIRVLKKVRRNGTYKTA